MNIFRVLARMDDLMQNEETDWGFLPESIRSQLKLTTYSTVKNRWEFTQDAALLLPIALGIECDDGAFDDYALAAKQIVAYVEGREKHE